jgi:hypothetical protein
VVYGSGARDPGLETLLSEVEASYHHLIGRIDQADRISWEEKQDLALFLAFLFSRVPRYERAYDEVAERTLKRKLRTILPSPEAIAAYVKSHPEIAAKHPNLNPANVDDFLRGEHYRIQIPRAYSIVSGVRSVLVLAPQLAMLEWRFASAPTGKSFLTCDDPIVLIREPGHKLTQQFSHLSGFSSLVPLSQRTCLLVCAPGPFLGTGRVSDAAVHNINKAIASQASEFLIARDRPLLRRFVKSLRVS